MAPYLINVRKVSHDAALNIINTIMTYELVTVLLIVGAGLAGTSEVTKNNMVGYPGFVIGSAGIIILLLFLFTGTTG